MKAIITCACLLLFSCLVSSQNLVPNSGFEEYTKCPNKVSQLDKSQFWYSPTKGTPDFYCTCAPTKSDVGIPDNKMGSQQPHSGNAYTGLIIYNIFNENAEREYLEIKLTTSLKKDSLYCIKFYVSLADKSGFASDAIGAYVSIEPTQSDKWCTLYATPTIANPEGNMLTQTDWTCISGTFKATGGEQYLTIGNFFKSQQTGVKKHNNTASGYAYYYLDDVTLVGITAPTQCACEEIKALSPAQIDTNTEKKPAIVLDSSIVLKNIFFETDKAELLPLSYKELDSLETYLKLRPGLSIKISGYTDNQGSPQHNLALSKARAEAVADYLTGKGIDLARVNSEGYGNTNPLADNNTEAGRAKNRRVEFKITEIKK
jgi:outer membrane protein OmpA-like peptidoglycan-associated protein